MLSRFQAILTLPVGNNPGYIIHNQPELYSFHNSNFTGACDRGEYRHQDPEDGALG